MLFLTTKATRIISISTYTWYSQLIKPAWAPPAWLFGPVWTVLYVLIAFSFGWVFYKIIKGQLPKIIAVPFILNLVANAFFTPLQFGLQNNLLAAIDILVVLGSLIWIVKISYPKIRWVAYLQIPYLLWVSFATILQVSIALLNW